MSLVTTDNQPGPYVTIGTGTALVMVSGTGLDAQTTWGHLAPAFADCRTVVLSDYAGGSSMPLPHEPLTVELLADQMAAVAAAASEEPVDVVGYSLGAVVAAAMAARHPHLVRRLVLVAGWPDADDSRHRLAIDLWQRLEQADHDLFNRFLQLICFSPSFLSAIGDEGVAGLLAGAPPITPGMVAHMDLDRRVDVSPLLHQIAAPTLVVGLTRDQVVPIERARQLQEGIAGSRFAEIDSGHLVIFEQPEALVALVREFLLEG